MSLIIESLFTLGGTPDISLTPTLKLWEIVGASKNIILNNVSMTNGGDGYYLYEYTELDGYDSTKIYTVLVDGGNSLPPNERWQTITYSPTDVGAIADAVWDEPATDHLIVGSTGELLNKIEADTQQLRLDSLQILNLLDELLKYDRNRTMIDKVNKELIIFEADNLTVFKRFKLRDSNGVPSIGEVCERLPI